jgi:hypothetical protein
MKTVTEALATETLSGAWLGEGELSNRSNHHAFIWVLCPLPCHLLTRLDWISRDRFATDLRPEGPTCSADAAPVNRAVTLGAPPPNSIPGGYHKGLRRIGG